MPDDNRVVVLINGDDTGRIDIIIYNQALDDVVPVNLSAHLPIDAPYDLFSVFILRTNCDLHTDAKQATNRGGGVNPAERRR